jgi:hypothetical protein
MSTCEYPDIEPTVLVIGAMTAEEERALFAPPWEAVLDSSAREVALRPRANPSYEIDMDTVQTFADVAHWLSHLSEKRWVTGEVLFGFYCAATQRLPESERPKGWDRFHR